MAERFFARPFFYLSSFSRTPWLEEVIKWSVAKNTQCGFEEPTLISAPASPLSLPLQSMVRRSKKAERC